MNADELSKLTAEELRALAVERNVRWQDKNGKALRKMDLLDVLERDLNKARTDDTAEVALPRMPSPALSVEPEPETKPDAAPVVEATPAVGPFRVTKDSRYVISGVAHQIKRGAIVQGDTHDMDALREQHVPMELASNPELQAAEEPTRRIDFDYGPPVVGVRQYVPIGETTVVNRSPEEAQYVDMMPDGTRVPVPGTPVPKRTEIEAKVKR